MKNIFKSASCGNPAKFVWQSNEPEWYLGDKKESFANKIPLIKNYEGFWEETGLVESDLPDSEKRQLDMRNYLTALVDFNSSARIPTVEKLTNETTATVKNSLEDKTPEKTDSHSQLSQESFGKFMSGVNDVIRLRSEGLSHLEDGKRYLADKNEITKFEEAVKEFRKVFYPINAERAYLDLRNFLEEKKEFDLFGEAFKKFNYLIADFDKMRKGEYENRAKDIAERLPQIAEDVLTYLGKINPKQELKKKKNKENIAKIKDMLRRFEVGDDLSE